MSKYLTNPDANELYMAAYEGNIPVLASYLNLGGNSNIPVYNANLIDSSGKANGYEYTFLGVACMGGQKEVVELLLENNANPNMRNYIKNKDGVYRAFTPLQLVAQKDSPIAAQIAKELLRYGANIDYATPQEKANYPQGAVTPLQMAAQGRARDVMEVLLDAGAAISQPDRDSNQALHYAVASGSMACVELLLDRGADVNAINKDGNTPAHVAANVNNREILAFLVKRGADMSIKNYEDKAPRTLLQRLPFELHNNASSLHTNDSNRRQLNELAHGR